MTCGNLSNNNWIFVQSQTTKLYLECQDKNIIEFNIIGPGIVNVPINCVAYCKSNKLIQKFNNFLINVTSIKSDFKIINDSSCILEYFKFKIKEVSPIELNNIDLDIFTKESKFELKSISSEADNILDQHPIIQYETYYFVNHYNLCKSCILYF